MSSPTTYSTSGRRFALHLTPDVDAGVIAAVIDMLGYPCDVGPVAALDGMEVQSLRDDPTTLLDSVSTTATADECAHCHGNEEVEVATRQDRQTGAWDTETVRCSCTREGENEPPY